MRNLAFRSRSGGGITGALRARPSSVSHVDADVCEHVAFAARCGECGRVLLVENLSGLDSGSPVGLIDALALSACAAAVCADVRIEEGMASFACVCQMADDVRGLAAVHVLPVGDAFEVIRVAALLVAAEVVDGLVVDGAFDVLVDPPVNELVGLSVVDHAIPGVNDVALPLPASRITYDDPPSDVCVALIRGHRAAASPLRRTHGVIVTLGGV